MMNFQHLSLNSLLEGYEEELQVSREDEVGYGFELFRRAIEERDDGAWNALHLHHTRMIYSWINNHPFGVTLGQQEKEDITQETWTKFYRNVIKRPAPLVDHFKHVGALFSYLKRCVITVTIDRQRKMAKDNKLQKRLSEDQYMKNSTPEIMLNRLFKEAQRAAVMEWVTENVTDREERLVLGCSYQEGLRPKEIVERYPNEFDVHKVYRIKERLLKRAKRSFEMTRW
ncbi:MAG: RNA polymerase sigma factor [Ardenticatenaceae bacterium]